MIGKLLLKTAAALFAASFAATAGAYTVFQDGLGLDVSYSLSGQTAAFRVDADFTGATTSWIGDTMDSFSLQFGSVGKNNIIASHAGISSTDAAGVWTGFLDKVTGNGCSGNTSEAICFTVLPTATGGDGASIIAAGKYFWEFALEFNDGIDVGDILAGSHSVKFLSVKYNAKNGKWSTGDQLSQEGIFTCRGADCDPVPCGPECDPTSVPAPTSLALLGIGLLGFAALRRRA